MDMHLEAVLSAAVGSAVAGFLAKFIFTRAIRDLDIALDKIEKISNKLAEITVKLEHYEKNEELVRELDRKIIGIEAIIKKQNVRSLN